jgi:hypothetical protein
MLLALLLTISLTTGDGPMEAALQATEAPKTLRAAFTVALESQRARRVYAFDPRKTGPARWTLIDWQGEDDELEDIGRTWAQEAAPDGRLFPDDLRASLGPSVKVDELGGAWRVKFQHAPSANDSDYDIWAAERLAATAWMDPVGERFLRIDYALPAPTPGPEGGTVTRYDQTYYLKTEPRWGMSYVSGFSVSLEGRAGFHRLERRYSASIIDADFFFANAEAEAAFEAGHQGLLRAARPLQTADAAD